MWIKAKVSMMAEARRLGLELLVELSSDDAAQQAEQARSLVDRGVGALVLAPADSAAAAAIVDHAAGAGVPVIAYDRMVTETTRDLLYLSFDSVKVGDLQGEFLSRLVPRGTYYLFHGSADDNNSRLFKEGAMRHLQPRIDRGEIRVGADEFIRNFSVQEARRACAEALKRSGNRVDAILAATDTIAQGADQALRQAGLAGKVPITGLDAEAAAVARVLRGTQGMTVFKDVRVIARRIIEVAAQLAQGKPVDTGGVTVHNGRRQVPAILLPPEAVTRDSYQRLLVDSGYLSAKAIETAG
jgi:D-xylose transport system substrate-binding protein